MTLRILAALAASALAGSTCVEQGTPRGAHLLRGLHTRGKACSEQRGGEHAVRCHAPRQHPRTAQPRGRRGRCAQQQARCTGTGSPHAHSQHRVHTSAAPRQAPHRPRRFHGTLSVSLPSRPACNTAQAHARWSQWKFGAAFVFVRMPASRHCATCACSASQATHRDSDGQFQRVQRLRPQLRREARLGAGTRDVSEARALKYEHAHVAMGVRSGERHAGMRLPLRRQRRASCTRRAGRRHAVLRQQQQRRRVWSSFAACDP
jgi:hypothetical protein